MFKKISYITFKISEYCNLDCEYCFQKHDVKTRLNKFKYYDDLLLLLEKLPLDNELEIKITGGEPSLFASDIYDAYYKLKKIERYKDTKIRFTTISNGSNMEDLIKLMDDGILDPKGCKISWDGIYSASKSRHPKNIEKYNDSFFNEKIAMLGKSKYNDKVLVRMALTPNTVLSLYNSFFYAVKNGCKKLEYYYLSDCEAYNDLDFIDRCKEQFINIAEFKNCIDNNEYLKKQFGFTYSNWDSLFFTEFCLDKEKDKLRSISCRHLGRFLYIEQNGMIAPCGYFSKDGIFAGTEFYIGDIFNGFYKDKVEEFINKFKEVPMCYNTGCDNLHCFECPAVSYYRKNNMAEKLYQTCKLRNIEKEIFLNYNKKGSIEEISKAKGVFNYTNNWNIDYSTPNLPYKLGAKK